MKYIVSLLLLITMLNAKDNQAICSVKNALPVAINANIAQDSAQAKIRFLHSLENVVINLKGFDGLKVISVNQPTHYSLINAGEEIILDIGFLQPSGKSYLSIAVTAKYNKKTVSSRKSFKVGSLSTMQKSNIEKNITLDVQGNKLLLMPVQ